MSKLTLEQLNLISPTRFTGLHAHSSFSTFDGLGYPKEHIDFVLSLSLIHI